MTHPASTPRPAEPLAPAMPARPPQPERTAPARDERARRWQVLPLGPGEGLGLHRAAWDVLNQRLMRNHPMLSGDFVDRMLRHFGDGRQVLCLRGTSDRPEAMAILQRRGGGLWTTFLPSQAQVGPLLLSPSEPMGELIRSLPGPAVGLDLLCVDPAFIEPARAYTASEKLRHALTMNVTLSGSFDAYWAARPSGLRQNIRRYERRAAAEMPLRHDVVTDPAGVVEAVQRYATLESQGWKGAAGTALGPDNEQGRFYTGLMRACAEAGQAEVHELWLGETLAASRLIVHGGQLVVMLKTTYNEALDKHAPGRVLLRAVLENLFARHAGKQVEFYTDATQDQLAWATGQRVISHMTLYRGAAAQHLVTGMRMTRQLLRPRAADAGGLEVALHASLDELPEDAIKLMDAAEDQSLQFGTDWYRTLTRAVFAGSIVRFAVVRDGAHCIAVLPALVQQRRRGHLLSGLANYYTSLFAPALSPRCKPAGLTLALQALARDAGGAASFTFAPMDPDSEAYQHLYSALEQGGWFPFRFFCFGNWYQRIESSWADYEHGLDSRVRNTLARTLKRFLADGGRFEILREPAELQAALASYLQVYAHSWKRAEPYPEFLPELIRVFGQRGCVRLGLAWLHDKPVAAQIWLVADRKADIYKLAHDMDFSRYSPGSLLTAKLLRHVLEVDRVDQVDYLSGDDAYKKDWLRSRRERWGIAAYHTRSLAGLLQLLGELLRRSASGLLKTARARPGAARGARPGAATTE